MGCPKAISILKVLPAGMEVSAKPKRRSVCFSARNCSFTSFTKEVKAHPRRAGKASAGRGWATSVGGVRGSVKYEQIRNAHWRGLGQAHPVWVFVCVWFYASKGETDTKT